MGLTLCALLSRGSLPQEASQPPEKPVLIKALSSSESPVLPRLLVPSEALSSPRPCKDTHPQAEPALQADSLLLEGLWECREVIELPEAAIPTDELGRRYLNLLHDHPELFHVAPRLSYTYSPPRAGAPSRSFVTSVRPVYTLTGEALHSARAFYRQALEDILSEMEASLGSHPPTEADTLLWLHDYLATHFTYDTRSHVPNADAYSFLREGRGVCQAYALTLLALCRCVGLEAELVISEAMDHAWNHVRVEGVWYHVDVTRNAPIPSASGQKQVYHARLLRSDEGMTDLGYHGFTCASGHSCSDTDFQALLEEADQRGLTQGLVFCEGRWLGETPQGGLFALRLPTREDTSGGMGEEGDVDLNGQVDPADLLSLYHPSLPETWRERLRHALVEGMPCPPPSP